MAVIALWRAASGGLWRENRGRSLLALLGIALGVALGTAVSLIHGSAINDFSIAVRGLAGEADLVVRGPRSGFREDLYATIARLPEVEAASPAVEADVLIAGSRESLKIIGIDPFQTARVQPGLLTGSESALLRLLGADAAMLSLPASREHRLATGDRLPILAGTEPISLEIVHVLPAGAYSQPLALMDIASAQWRLGQLGRINRVDIRLRAGTDAAAFADQLKQKWLPPGVDVATPDAEARRGASLSRAYRVNLSMLALVALLTGAFLVFATQVVSVLRRRSQLAVLRVIGLTRTKLTALLVAEGALLGAVGALLGIVAGTLLAGVVVERAGLDLGAGYFRSLQPALRVEPGVLALFWLLGVSVAVIGALLPAVEAGRSSPARALKPGDEETAMRGIRTPVVGLALLICGGMAAAMPPVQGLPVFGYAAIALLIAGTILLMPAVAVTLSRWLPRRGPPEAMLALAQLGAAPRQAAISIAAIVASFSLMVAMIIMVSSFRASLDTWLSQLLPADVYLRSVRAGESGHLTPADQAAIINTPGVREARFLRSQTVLLRPDLPALTVLAREIDFININRYLPLVLSAPKVAGDDLPPAWVSEIAASLMGWKAGKEVELPLAGNRVRFRVAGIWRDYARQNGAIVIERDTYVRLTGDSLANDAALWLAPGITLAEVGIQLRSRLAPHAQFEISGTREIKALSLATFDRTFAITYALELIAIVIGLFGVSVSFSARTLARRREFGVLRHIGMSIAEIRRMIAIEGATVAGLGVSVGLALGWVIGFILIHVVNRQSFHWTMDLEVPWGSLLALGTLLVLAACVTAVVSSRQATGGDLAMAVREDW